MLFVTLLLLVSFAYTLDPPGIVCKQLPVTLPEGNVWLQVEGGPSPWRGRSWKLNTPNAPAPRDHPVDEDEASQPPISGGPKPSYPQSHLLTHTHFTGFSSCSIPSRSHPGSPPNPLHPNPWGARTKRAQISSFSRMDSYLRSPEGRSCRSAGEEGVPGATKTETPQKLGSVERCCIFTLSFPQLPGLYLIQRIESHFQPHMYNTHIRWVTCVLLSDTVPKAVA